MSRQAPDHALLAARIRGLARAAGFQRVGISGVDLADDETFL
ncbi:MAG: tRNA epoxyqueuosine(34) reductase QueG, partial [Lysobacteraceae bacterium]